MARIVQSDNYSSDEGFTSEGSDSDSSEFKKFQEPDTVWRQRMAKLKIAGIALLLAVQLAVFIFCHAISWTNWFEPFCTFNGFDPNEDWVKLYFKKAVDGGYARQIGAVIAFAIFVAFELRTKQMNASNTNFLNEANRYMALNWITNVLQAVNWTVAWYLPMSRERPLYFVEIEDISNVTVASFFKLMVDMFSLGTDTYFYLLVQHRLQLVEEGFGRPLGSRAVLVIRWLFAFTVPLLFFVYAEINHGNISSHGWFWATVNLSQCVAPSTVAAILWYALSRVLWQTRVEVPGLRGYSLAEKEWAEAAVSKLRW